MKVLKEKSREYNGKAYFKYKINLSSEVMKAADLKEGDELEAVEVKKGEMRLKRK